MGLSVEERVMVAKDRALDDLINLTGDGYWHRTPEIRKQIRDIASKLAMPDNSKKTLKALRSYINGEEHLFFAKT